MNTEGTRQIFIDGKEYKVSLKRFDEDIDPENGATYHGFYLQVMGEGLNVTARKYDDSAEMSVQDGVQEGDTQNIKILRGVAKELFNTEKLSLLTTGDPPYKQI